MLHEQARIDQYIIPCMVVQGFGSPFSGNSLRDRIPGSMWVQMTRATDIEDVLQYYTLPDLGEYVRERMCCQSVTVPTGGAPNSPQGCTPVGSTLEHELGHTLSPGKKTRKGGAAGTKASLVDGPCHLVPAVMHLCCPLSSQQARDAHEGGGMGRQFTGQAVCDHGVCLPGSCTSSGCIHGSLISVLLGSVMPLYKRTSQCRR